jgi:hypothetical protein
LKWSLRSPGGKEKLADGGGTCTELIALLYSPNVPIRKRRRNYPGGGCYKPDIQLCSAMFHIFLFCHIGTPVEILKMMT